MNFLPTRSKSRAADEALVAMATGFAHPVLREAQDRGADVAALLDIEAQLVGEVIHWFAEDGIDPVHVDDQTLQSRGDRIVRSMLNANSEFAESVVSYDGLRAMIAHARDRVTAHGARAAEEVLAQFCAALQEAAERRPNGDFGKEVEKALVQLGCRAAGAFAGAGVDPAFVESYVRGVAELRDVAAVDRILRAVNDEAVERPRLIAARRASRVVREAVTRSAASPAAKF